MSSTRIAVIVSLLLALVLSAAACSAGGTGGWIERPGLELGSDDALDSGLVALWKQGGSRRLAELTSFRWDGLRIFAEGAPAETVNDFVGSEVVSERYYLNSRNLFVFTDAGKPVRLVMVSSDFLDRDSYGRTFGPDVRLTVDEPGQGFGRLDG